MKIIFLDVDGVLNSWASLAHHIHLDSRCVILINTLLDITGAKLVLSSTWRMNERSRYSLFVGGLSECCFHDDWRTPVFNDQPRGDEIADWLSRNTVDQYIIIDDDSDFHEDQLPFHVQTEMKTGFGQRHFKQALELLGGVG
jgi:hypothetical protein